MTISNKISSMVATGALLFSMATPALAADSIEIIGNGAGSTNAVAVTDNNSTTVGQSNSANVTNNVTSKANSGGNDANFNTGGDTKILTGGAQTVTNVSTAVNANIAQLDNCNCASNGAADVTISGNGAGSHNAAAVSASNATTLGQTNSAAITNNVASKANSGKNGAAFNTGGDTSITTGPAVTLTTVSNAANVNSASIGGGAAVLGANNAASALITGNGAGSVNGITLNLPSSLTVGQSNSATILNNVESKANSGKNNADFNTGGDTHITTGPAAAKTTVDNLANFNFADLDCGCLVGGVYAKIAGNGASGGQAGTTWNTILANLGNTTVLGQTNGAYLTNNTGSKANSGYNGAAFNTGAVSGISDPSVTTGPSYTENNVSNVSNLNDASSGATLNLPGGVSLNLLLDLGALWSWMSV